MDRVTFVKNQYRLEQWTALLQDFRSSGMKVEDWCKTTGVTTNAYYYWLRKVRKAACENLPEGSSTPSAPSFRKLEVQAPRISSPAAVVIHLPAVTLEVQNGASQQTVETVLLALRSIC